MTSTRVQDVAWINRRTLPETTAPDFEFKYVDIGAVSEGRVTVPDDRVKFAVAPSRARRRAYPGDVLVSTVRTYLRAISPVPDGDEELVFSTGFAVLEAKSQVDCRYLGYFCLGAPFVQEVEARSVGVSYPAVNASDIAKIHIDLPSLEEQRRIADFLDAETTRIDSLSSATEQQATLLDERLQESFRESTTTAGEKVEPTGIPWMPLASKEWALKKVAHHFVIGGGATPSSANPNYFGEGVFWVNSGDVKNGTIDVPSKSLTLKAVRDCSSLEIHPRGALVVALYGQGETKGRVGILGVEACLNQACCALIASGDIRPEYAFFWFRAHKSGVVSLAVGAGQPNLSQELVKSLWLPVPGLEKQAKIVAQLKEEEGRAVGLINSLKMRKRLLGERRQALITAAVTGEFDVSAASGRGIEE